MTEKIGPHAQLWVDALRSGEYEQGRGRLRRDDTYCCLGVLCDVFRKHEGQGKWIHGAADVFEINHDLQGAEPPFVVWNWVTKGRLGAHLSSLIRANDTGLPFDRIADMIESDPLFDR